METGCAYNSHSVCHLKGPVGFANHDLQKTNKSNGHGRIKTRNRDPEQKRKKTRRKKAKDKEVGDKKEREDNANGKRTRKEQLAKLEQ